MLEPHVFVLHHQTKDDGDDDEGPHQFQALLPVGESNRDFRQVHGVLLTAADVPGL